MEGWPPSWRRRGTTSVTRCGRPVFSPTTPTPSSPLITRSSAPAQPLPPPRATRPHSTASPRAGSGGPRRSGCSGAASSWPTSPERSVPATGAVVSWPRRSARTERHWRTARSTGAGTGAASPSSPHGIGGAWRCWSTPVRTCSRWRPCPTSTRLSPWSPPWQGHPSPPGCRTRSAADARAAGQPLVEAFAAVADSAEIVAVGVNCCDPDDVAPALAVARQVTDKPLVVYPNSGERWDAGARRWTSPSHFSPAHASAWIAAGAFAVGGCCRVRPSDIAALAAVAAQNRTLAPKCDPGAAPDRTMAPKCGSKADPPGRSCSVERRRR